MIVRNRGRTGSRPTAQAGNGFSLLELTIAMAIFLIISSVSFSLFNQQQKSANLLRGQTGLNMSLRSAAAGLQIDLAGAGSGYFQGVNMPSWPTAVSIVNHVVTAGNSCYNSTTKVYGTSCFDQINIITAASPNSNCGPTQSPPCYPPIFATDSTGGNSATLNWSDTSTGIAYGQAPAVINSAGVSTQWTLAQTAAAFKSGDQVLFVNNAGTQLTTAVLTGASVLGSAVKFTFHATQADGSNTSLTYDPLDITYCDGAANCATNNTLTNKFYANASIIKLAPITYQVCSGPGSPTPCDQSSTSPDINDPKLVKVQNGVMSVVMEQIIGFKVGVTLWNGASETADNDSVTSTYNYDSSTYTVGNATTPSPYNFSLVRSVRVSVIGRTAPSKIDNEFKNAFDQGSYQVQGIAVVVNPRNMSMNDN